MNSAARKGAFSLARASHTLRSSPSSVAAIVRPAAVGSQAWRPYSRGAMTTPVDSSATKSRQMMVEAMMMPYKAQARTVASSAAQGTDEENVLATVARWRDTVTSGGPDAPKKTASLYAKDGALWGTVSEQVRDTPQEIRDYFDFFACLPNLRVTEHTPVSVRIFGDFASEAGSYTFAWETKDGETVEKKARYSFSFRRDANSPTAWTIVDHHSSVMPTAPQELKPAKVQQ